MLTITDVPAEVLRAYNDSKCVAEQIIVGVLAGPDVQQILAKVDLFSAYRGRCIFIHDGIYRYEHGGRFIRFYSAGDLVVIPEDAPPEVTVISDFATEASILTTEEFLERLAADRRLLELYERYRALSEIVLHGLASVYIGEGFNPMVDIRRFGAGESIIREGDAPESLFELIEGGASVSVAGTPVGEVKEGELFGEVSFLTGRPRTATVTAQSTCLVHVIRIGAFERVVKYRPALMYTLSRTLARRLTDVNVRLTRIGSLT
jgi:hypothetical protein